MNEVGAIADSPELDESRRKFLTVAASAAGARLRILASKIPFVESWTPSERARALGAPVDVDISKVQIGQMITATWRRQVIYIVRRPQSLVDALSKHDDILKDPKSEDSIQPDYVKNEMRVPRRAGDMLVLIGYCTHLGCLPKPFFDPGDAVLGAHWPEWLSLPLPRLALRSGRAM